LVSTFVGDVALTTCESAALVDAAFAASPLYEATMLCTPATSALVLHAAVPGAATETAAQPVIVVPESLKLTVPVGTEPATVAVSVTAAPSAAGFAELASVVVVAVGDLGVNPQLPLTLPAPFSLNVAVARQPGVIAIC
jgi:hypothetical protein